MEQTQTNTAGCCGVKRPLTKSGVVKLKRHQRESGVTLHPDHSAQLTRLNRIAGQIEGVKRMIQTRRYCPEILVQTRAISSAIKAVELQLIGKHVRHCVTGALLDKRPKEIERKIEELITVLDRF